MEDHKVELAKFILPNTIINNICKHHDEECQDCTTQRRLPKIMRCRIKVKEVDGFTFLFDPSHFFPEKEVLREDFNFSFRRIVCLRLLDKFTEIHNNNTNIVELILLENVNQDNKIDDLNNKLFCFFLIIQIIVDSHVVRL